MVMAPEGTRRKTSGWKSGFYHIAVKANVPIGMAYLDYKNKDIGLTDFFTPSGDVEKDLIFFREFYKDKIGCRPENAAPIEFSNSPKL
jgi:1-acyl-sn-glycerol-3-phosphate acyltransferase